MVIILCFTQLCRHIIRFKLNLKKNQGSEVKCYSYTCIYNYADLIMFTWHFKYIYIYVSNDSELTHWWIGEAHLNWNEQLKHLLVLVNKNIDWIFLKTERERDEAMLPRANLLHQNVYEMLLSYGNPLIRWSYAAALCWSCWSTGFFPAV